MNEWVLRFFHLNVWPLLLVGPSLTNIVRAMPRVIFGHLIPVSTTDQVHGALEWAESDSTMDYREVCADGRSSGLNSRHADGSFSKKREKRLTDGLMFGWFLNTERPGIISWSGEILRLHACFPAAGLMLLYTSLGFGAFRLVLWLTYWRKGTGAKRGWGVWCQGLVYSCVVKFLK